jgi:hypothetical protein
LFKAGDVLIGPFPAGSRKRRRFLVLSDEIIENDPEVVWAYVSTSMNDKTCVLPSGCHPDITQDCCVVYAEAEVVKVCSLKAAIADGALVQSATPLSTNPVGVVQEGLFESEDTSTKVVNFSTNRT